MQGEYYRIYDVLTEIGFGVAVKCYVEKWYFVRKTPKGVWISQYRQDYNGMQQVSKYSDKWIGDDHVKKYAYPTMEEAIVGYRARKKREVSILESRLRQAEAALELSKTEGFIDNHEYKMVSRGFMS